MKQTKYLIILFILIGISCSDKNTPSIKDYAKLVDPMIGTDWNGHTFPGATLPYGMVQLSPDTKTETWNNCSGYHYSDKSILGFSHTHYSGTGAGGGSDIMFMPTVGNIQLNSGENKGTDNYVRTDGETKLNTDEFDNTKNGYRSKFSHDNEFASPGYYSVFLDDYEVQAELTTTQRVGFHKYTFPKTQQANIILDLVHGNSDWPDSLFLQVKNNEISGYRAASGGLDGTKTIYFVAEFSKPFESYGLVVNDTILDKRTSAKGKNVKAFFRFSTNENESILLKVAISTINIEGARKNMKAELPKWDFELTRKSAEEVWNIELNKIDIEGGTKEQQKIFYTALYHSFIHPNIYMDVDRQYRSTNGKVYKADDFDNYTNFSLWDTFRALHPLQTIINPERTTQFIKTFIERYEHALNMPIMEFSGNECYSMIGYHSLPVMADAYVKGIRDYDVQKAFNAMKQLADGERTGKKAYLQYGFIPFDFKGQAASRTLEYSYDDWCVTRLARDFNETDYQYYNQRGKFYQNIYSKKHGFMCPKSSAYKWLENFDPMEGTHQFTEANAYQYTPSVMQDIEGLIKLIGGDKEFEKWLDISFSTETDTTKMTIPDVTGMIGQYAHGNEPSHHIAYLYNYVGTAHKTQKLIRQILTTLYTHKPDGISGNEDAGQMSAWFVLSSMGFYSVTPGMNYYVIGSPLFDKVTINLENGKKFKIIAKNNKPENVYIQSVTLNEKPYSKSHLKHADIINGSELVFNMGKEPNTEWGKTKENRPYSDKYESAPMPKFSFTGRRFLDSSAVSLSCKNKNAIIRYTLDGTQPDKNSKEYMQTLSIKESTIIKARCFVEGLQAGYPVSINFQKLNLKAAQIVSSLKPGLKYVYKEGFCDKTSDLDRYPVKNTGIIHTFNVDSIKDGRAFGYHYKGFIKIPADGLYNFQLESNDGAVLYIDDEMVINNDGGHPAQTLLEQMALKKGYHSINLDYFQMGRAKKLVVKWERKGFDFEEIPANQLFH